MGTSHRYKATVKGQPNWGQSSAAITAMTAGVVKLAELNKNPPENETAKQIAKRHDRLERQISYNYRSAIRHLVRAAGGRHTVSSGSSCAFGRAGISSIGGLVAVIHEIANKGLSEWLRKRGETLEGKRACDVIDAIRGYMEIEIVGLDHTAANEAMEYVLDKLEEMIGEDVEKIDDVLDAILSGCEIKDLIALFFGMYIYSHLSQSFEEKLEYEKGSVATKDAMDQIKEQILDDVRTARLGHDVRAIDWSNPEGDAFIKAEFDRIIYIIQGNED